MTLELKQVEAHNTTRLKIISFLTIFSSCRNLISSFFVELQRRNSIFPSPFPPALIGLRHIEFLFFSGRSNSRKRPVVVTLRNSRFPSSCGARNSATRFFRFLSTGQLDFFEFSSICAATRRETRVTQSYDNGALSRVVAVLDKNIEI